VSCSGSRFERRKMFDPSRASALPWLYGIGSNLLAKHRRGEARRLRASARMGRVWTRRTGARTPGRSTPAAFPRVAPRSRRCPPGERERSCLRVEDLSVPERAEALELPIGTVRSRLNRARTQLRELLEPGGEKRMKPR